jgi:hypothetical protein
VTLAQTSMLGRLIRWRIPGTPTDVSFDELFRNPPFVVLHDDPGNRALVSGMVGRIWTLRRDYPLLGDAQEYREFSQRGTARVLFASWVEDEHGGASVASEARVTPIGAQGRIGVAAVRPLVRAFQQLIASEGLDAAVRRAEQR